MKNMRIVAALGIAALLSACIPIEQAPLVYSSKDQFGVGVAAGTPDAPGLDVNIGYKGLDTAFVPVMTAKRCRGSATECAVEHYRLQMVLGNNKVSGGTIVDQREIDTLTKAIAAGDREIDEKSRQVAQIRESETKLAEAQRALAALPTEDPAASPPRVLTGEEIAAKSRLQAEIQQLQQLAGRSSEADALEQDVRQTAISIAQKSEQLERLLARRGEVSGDDKVDALSVFGSFNGSAEGDSGGAGLSLGKAFSTGVAAQHLTQGISAGAKQLAIANCINAAAQVLKDAGTTEDQLRERLIKLCDAEPRR